MDYIYILIGAALAFLGVKHFGPKSNRAEEVARADAKLKADADIVDGEIDSLKDKIDNVKDDRNDKENYWNNN